MFSKMDFCWFLFTTIQLFAAVDVSEPSTNTPKTPNTDLTEEFSHYGTDFYLAVTSNYVHGSRTLHIASDKAGVLRVKVPEINANEKVDLVKGCTKYNITVISHWKQSIYLKTSVPVAITVVDTSRGIGVFLALPVTFAGTLFMAAGSRGWYFGVAVMAVYDDTNVTLVDLDNKTEASKLNRFGIFDTRDYLDKTGATISSSKPVTLISGTTKHTSNAGSSIEQMLPYEAWTDLYIVPPLPSKRQFSVRTLSIETQNVCLKSTSSETCFQVTKATTNTTYKFGTDPIAVSSSSRISVIQYESVNDRSSGGDAIMVVIPGIMHYLNTYRFAIPDIPETNPYIMSIVLSSDATGILLDGSAVSFDTAGSVDTSLGKYSILMTRITPGYHEMRHTKKHARFGALAYGFDGKNSYAFPLGFTYTKRVNVGPWSPWTDCAIKYTGQQSRTRFCENQTELVHGDICNGVDIEERQCFTHTCPVNGYFNDWSVWSSCSRTCGPGNKVRRRYCNNQEPTHGGADCIGAATDTQPCKEQSCPVLYNFLKIEEEYCLNLKQLGTWPEAEVVGVWSGSKLFTKATMIALNRITGFSTYIFALSNAGIEFLTSTSIPAVVPYGYECDLGQDKCDGNHTACDHGRCHCLPGYYQDGDRCISKTYLCGASKQGNAIVIVGVVMGVIIVALTVYAVYVTIQLRRQTPDKGVSSHQREENPDQVDKEFDHPSNVVAMEASNAKEGVRASTDPYCTTLYSELKDKSDANDVSGDI